MPINCRRVERSLPRFAFSHCGHWSFLPCGTSVLTVEANSIMVSEVQQAGCDTGHITGIRLYGLTY